MKMTDGKKTINITMREWNGSGYNPDWSNDFFDAGSLSYDAAKDAYIVEDVDYCIDQANDCINHTGDFFDGEEKNENEYVFVEEITK